MKRRDFIKITAGGVAALALGSGLAPVFRRSEAYGAVGDATNFFLDIMEVEHEMVDGKLVYSWAYAVKESGVQVPSLPGPTLFVRQGSPVNVTLTNTMSDRPTGEAHGFAIFGKNGPIVQSAPLAAGQSTQFTIPGNLAPGTYMYEDWVNPPVGRVLGLHGVLVVMPAAPAGSPYKLYPDTAPPVPGWTPYGILPNGHPVRELFNDLGQTAHFPGEPWLPSRQVIWVFSEVDPFFNELASTELIDAGDFQRNFLPQYFTVNGRSGFFSAEDHTHDTTHVHVDFNQPLSYILSGEMESALVGKVGQPILIRNVHVGLDTHSPHTHANHCYCVAVDGEVQDLNIDSNGFPVNGNPRNLGLWWWDTWTMLPGDRKDVLYPMMMPPDIPLETIERIRAGAWHPQLNPNGTQEYMVFDPNDTDGSSIEPLNVGHPPAAPTEFTHLAYPMHSHQEISQTAAGGNYPMGLIIHIMFTGLAPGV